MHEVFSTFDHICPCVAFAGYGVFATANFKKADFLLVYKGNSLHLQAALEKEEIYKERQLGCFMYFFRHNGKVLW